MTKTEIIELLTSMLLFDGSPSEKAMERLRAYLAAEKDEEMKREVLQTLLTTALRASRSFPFSTSAENIEQGWERLARELGLDPDIAHYRVSRSSEEEHPQPKLAPKFSFGRMALRVAAVIVPVVFAVGGYFAWDRLRSGDEVGTSETVVATTAAPVTYTHTVTAPGNEIRVVTLADGTQVTLNHNATLSYNDNREAELSGEAWFEVTKDTAHPFVIHSEGLKTTVLGTEFNFNTHTEAGESKLSLYDGVVRIDHATGTYRLDGAGREFVLDLATGRAEIHDFDVTRTRRSQWQRTAAQGRSMTEIIPLNEIFDLVETQYGVTITGREAVDTSRRFNFMLDNNATLDNVLRALQLAGGRFDYTINENTITLEKN